MLAYRQMSLLLRLVHQVVKHILVMFFILHSRLLERAAKLKEEKGGGSSTATYSGNTVWCIFLHIYRQM